MSVRDPVRLRKYDTNPSLIFPSELFIDSNKLDDDHKDFDCLRLGVGDDTFREVSVDQADNAIILKHTRNIDGIKFNGSANVVHFGTCNSAATTKAKTVSCNNFQLITGARIIVKFKNPNTAENPTLNVNSTGAKALMKSGTTPIDANAWPENGAVEFVYDGTNYLMLSQYTSRIQSAVNFTLSGVSATTETFDGSDGVNIEVTGVPVGLLDGVIDMSHIPQGAMERLYPVSNDNARFTLTKSQVQNGDIVKVTDTDLMYMVVDDTKLDSEDGYEVYKAGWASAVPWTGVTDKPLSNSYNDTSAGAAYKVATSKAVTDLYNYVVAEITKVNNGTTVAGAATKLNTARSIQIDLASTSSVNFDGTANVTPGVKNILGTANGGTGNNTGNAPTTTKLNTARYIDGVSFDGSADITHYGTCSVAAATKAKTVACTGFALKTGARILVKFTYANTNTAPTLNVNSTGAKNMVKYGTTAIDPNCWDAGAVVEFIYDGTSYVMGSGGSGKIYHVGTSAPSNLNLLWIDTTANTGGLKYHNGSRWVIVPVAYSST